MPFLTQSAMSPMDREAMLEQMRQQIRLAQILAPEGTEEREIARQQAYADELRKTGMPKGRSAGDVYRAANPLEFLTAAIQQGQGEGAQSTLQTRRQQSMDRLLASLEEERKRAEEEIRRAQSGQAQTQAAAMSGPSIEDYNPFKGGY